MREEPISLQGEGSWHLWLLKVSLRHCGHVFANSVRSCDQLAAFGHPNGQGALSAACLGQSWDNLLHRGGFWPQYLSDFAKTWSLGFRLDSGEARIQAQPASQNPRGAPSWLAWLHSPDLGLSAGGWLGVQLSKAGGRGGFIVLILFAVMTVIFYCVYL